MSELDEFYAHRAAHQFNNKDLDESGLYGVQAIISECNVMGNMNIQLIHNPDGAFHGSKGFDGVPAYVAICGRKEPSLYEKAGYFGDKICQRAQAWNVACSWAGKDWRSLGAGIKKGGKEKCVGVIAVGYCDEGVNDEPIAETPLESFATVAMEDAPAELVEWFNYCANIAASVPVNTDRSSVKLTLEGYNAQGLPLVRATSSGKPGTESDIDLGIVEHAFEVGNSFTGAQFAWAQDTKVTMTAAGATTRRFGMW